MDPASVSIPAFVGVRDTLHMRISMGLLDSPVSVVGGKLFPWMANTAFLRFRLFMNVRNYLLFMSWLASMPITMLSPLAWKDIGRSVRSSINNFRGSLSVGMWRLCCSYVVVQPPVDNRRGL